MSPATVGLNASPALAKAGIARLASSGKSNNRMIGARPLSGLRSAMRMPGLALRAMSDPYTIVSDDPEEVKREVGGCCERWAILHPRCLRFGGSIQS